MCVMYRRGVSQGPYRMLIPFLTSTTLPSVYPSCSILTFNRVPAPAPVRIWTGPADFGDLVI